MTANDGTTSVTTGPNGARVKMIDGRGVAATVGPGGATATVTPDR